VSTCLLLLHEFCAETPSFPSFRSLDFRSTPLLLSSSREELISFKLSVEETRKFIGADTLAYLPLDRLHKLLGDEADTYCDACFSGAYPVPPQGKNTQGHVLPFEEGHSGKNGNAGYVDVRVLTPEERKPEPAGRVV
jgi:hypothetical protein